MQPALFCLKMLRSSNRSGSSTEIPDLNQVPQHTTQIINLIGLASVKFFSILSFSNSFLHAQASNWTGDKPFQTMKQTVDNLHIVPEVVEQDKKLCDLFVGITEDVNRFKKKLNK